TSLALSPSGGLIASGSLDRTAKLWDVKTHLELATLGGNDDRVCQVAFTPDEKSVLTLTGDGKIKVWDLHAVLGRGVLWSTPGIITRFQVSPDERTIATTDNVGGLHIWDLVSRRELWSVQTGEPNGTSGGAAISFSPIGHVVAWAGWNWLGILDYDSGQTNTFRISGRYGFGDPAFSSDGRELAFAGPTNIMILDIATRKLCPFATIDNTVFGVAFSPNGTFLACAHRGGTLTVWDRASGHKIFDILAHPPEAFNVEFSLDGRLLASGGTDGT